MTDVTQETASNNKTNKLKKLLPLFILAAGLILFFGTGAHNYISEDVLRDNHETLTQGVANYPIVAPLLFGAAYVIVVLFSLPGGTLMSVAGGFLFGPFYGAFLVVFSATLGASGLFIAAKSSIGDSLREKAGPWMSKLEAGFKKNEFSYLLFLRLVPAFPFFVVNLVPAFLGVSLRNYVVGTFIGIIPGALVFTYFGAGLGKVFESGEAFSLSAVVTSEILIALSGLAALALLPVLINKIRNK
ncbi:TVP38/TMEM64 family protein [Curvivirga aplysinae]|uniref:TVP38/TMEM64 family protein n=1 Tax=Curvivirga aplysinae TaxID=2529852 RepID=UPI0012BBFB2A|nr:TVP38/TMEM64 family protein [Curvivirga aplysinae]MTI11349.1 TVP38/TMEM64 family protein [Curvivirga aplysinae]